MNRILDWFRQDKRYVVWGKALLLALLPFLCCAVTTAAQGKGIGEVYLPASEWNDELFYYKQVENIVNFGFPQGYFGFNESHGLVLSFAAWSPVLVLPWILWGLVFGWNFMAPVVCNILLMTAAVFLFMLLVRPTWKQMGIFTILFCLYTPFVRYMLSGMPEIICISHLIVFYGLVYSYGREEKRWKLAGMFVLSGLLTLMRPYMLLFLLLPDFFLLRGMRKKGKLLAGLFGAAGVTGAVLLGYALIKHYLGAEYFHPLFFTDWITVFFTDGFGAGVHNFFGTLYWKGKDFGAHMTQGLRTGLASGAFFAGYLVTLAVLCWQSAADYRKWRRISRGTDDAKEDGAKKAVQVGTQVGTQFRTQVGTQAGTQVGTQVGTQLVAEAHLAFSFVGMLFALLLMYKLTEGSKHLLTFMAVAVFVISLMDTRFFKKAVLVGACFAYLYTYKAVDPYDYQVPYVTTERQMQVEDWKRRFADALALTGENVPNYDNSVIWVFNEQSKAGATMKWQLLYALPEGFGISCCQSDHVLEHIDELQSRYLAAQNGAAVDERCAAAGWTELQRDEDMVLYERPSQTALSAPAPY
ncbi:MAG: hypothetical protein J6M66_03385 [Lachnospiraceae bacterium]|nr:hypothetical protein [Lachnospiraceae bacterium]